MNKEILLVAEAVSNEKGVDKEVIFQAIEAAIAMATKRKNGKNWDVRVAIDRESGEYETFRIWSVVANDEDIENPDSELSLEEAKEKDNSLEIGDSIEQSIESIEFGRIDSQTAKQVIVQKVREAERKKLVNEYFPKVGKLFSGVVKRVTRTVLFIELPDSIDAVLPREEMISKENFRINDRIKASLKEVRTEGRGPQLVLSRVTPKMLSELFKIEVPEIAEGIIEIMSVARDPGSRAKIAVKTNDGRIDPIGACIGMRGSRVQTISSELGGERVDIVLWDDDPVKFVINAMAPAAVSSIMMNEDKKLMTVVVSDDQMSQAVGREGQNVNLAMQLTGWKIDVLSQAQAEEVSKEEETDSKAAIENIMNALEIDEDMAEVLVEEGFSNLENLAYVDSDELIAIEGFDEEIAQELQNRAKQYVLTQALVSDDTSNTKPEQDLLDIEGMTEELASKLANAGITNREDLAEMSIAELIEDNLVDDAEQASDLIMKARAHWFE